VRVGIIGSHWGRMHVGAFRDVGAEVVALCGRDPSKTREIATSEGIALATTDVAELCDAVEIVVVASPDRVHARHVSQALEAGRHVLCEKPFTHTAEEARTLVAQERGRAAQRCAVSFPYRMLPPLAALARWLRDRPPARHLAVTVSNGFSAAEGWGEDGPLVGESGDFGGVSHVLDAALWFLDGTPAWVQASLTGRPVHSAVLEVGLAGGPRVSLSHLAATEPGIHGTWSIRGDGWQVGFTGGYEPALGGWRLGPIGVFEGLAGRELAGLVTPIAGRCEPWAEAHRTTARAFLDLVRDGEGSRGSLARFQDGARIQEVLDAAVRSELECRRIACGPGRG
jgi:myo-inositol 2-dehydrogenase / D-chiro-inositol 1-dehydrogenase